MLPDGSAIMPSADTVSFLSSTGIYRKDVLDKRRFRGAVGGSIGGVVGREILFEVLVGSAGRRMGAQVIAKPQVVPPAQITDQQHMQVVREVMFGAKVEEMTLVCSAIPPIRVAAGREAWDTCRHNGFIRHGNAEIEHRFGGKFGAAVRPIC